MRINEMIREKRIARGFTQEQVASYLGVSTPAVNKWEKGVSYPDITLLPVLARLLETDLNTLLSFQEDLTREEIGDFMNHIVSVASTQGIGQAFMEAEAKMREYPTSELLLLNAALTLEGFVTMSADTDKNVYYLDKIEAMYVQAAGGRNPEVRNQAKAMLIFKHMGRSEYDEAEKLLNELPDEAVYDKKHMQSNLYMAQGKTGQAALLMEQKIISEISGVQSTLYGLMEIALKDDRMEDARVIADTVKQMVRLFDMWEYSAHVVDFEMAVAQKDGEKCLGVMKEMFPSMMEGWIPSASPLYRHMPMKEDPGNMGQMLLTKIISEFEDENNSEYDFLRENSQVKEFLEEIKKKM